MTSLSKYVMDSFSAYLKMFSNKIDNNLWILLKMLIDIRSRNVIVSDNNLYYKYQDHICVIKYSRTHDRVLSFIPLSGFKHPSKFDSVKSWKETLPSAVTDDYVFDETDDLCIDRLLVKSKMS